MAEKMYPVYHRKCGEIGMLTTITDPDVGDALLAKDFFHIDGKPYQQIEKSICDNCKKPMPVIIESIDYENPVEIEDE